MIRRWPLLVSLALAALALLIPYWPLAFLGILLAAASGEWFAAVLLGIFFDALYGRPPGGALYTLAFPLTALAVLAAAARRIIGRYLRQEKQRYL